jgi:hypothetical protein
MDCKGEEQMANRKKMTLNGIPISYSDGEKLEEVIKRNDPIMRTGSGILILATLWPETASISLSSMFRRT